MKTIQSSLLGISLLAVSALAEAAPADNFAEGTIQNSDSLVAINESNNKIPVSFSGRIGLFDFKDSEFVDSSLGSQFEARFGIGQTPFDIVLRGHAASVELDDFIVYGSDAFPYKGVYIHEAVAMEVDNMEETVFGGSLQLQLNYERNAAFNPYIAVGAMYERSEIEADYAIVRQTVIDYKWLRGTFWDGEIGKIEIDEDGTAFIGRLGFEWKPAAQLYFRAEAAWMTKLYDDSEEKAQAELNAIVGFLVTENLRLDVAGTYYTEWEEYYITVGGTILLF